jgi:GT2 family glycosyltransferase
VIPVIGVPTLNRTDLLVRMIDSIDTDVGAILVIDNGGNVPELVTKSPSHVVNLPHNIGVAAAWNLVFKLTPRAPWWLIVNDDIAFGPGDLERLAAAMEDPAPRIAMIHGFSAFAINQQALELTGFFDENLHPAYFEDNDMTWRASMAGVPLVNVEAHVIHEGSATIRGHDIYMAQNGRTFSPNSAYYVEKWGGLPGHERYDTPFNGGGDIGAIRLSMERLNDHAWARIKPGQQGKGAA